MFGLFRGKTEMEKLQDKYVKLMKEAHTLSTSNRGASDAKVAEADQIAREIDKLRVY